MTNNDAKCVHTELQNKLIQSDIALYKANDYIKKLESKIKDLTKKNKQLNRSSQHYRKETEILKNENIPGLNVINNDLCWFFNCILFFSSFHSTIYFRMMSAKLLIVCLVERS